MGDALRVYDQTTAMSDEEVTSRICFNPSQGTLDKPLSRVSPKKSESVVIILQDKKLGRIGTQIGTIQQNLQVNHDSTPVDQTTLFFPGDLWGEIAQIDSYCNVEELEDAELAEISVEEAIRNLKW